MFVSTLLTNFMIIKSLSIYNFFFIFFLSLGSSDSRYELRRPWTDCLAHNKSLWKMRSVKGERHEGKCAMRKQISKILGLVLVKRSKLVNSYFSRIKNFFFINFILFSFFFLLMNEVYILRLKNKRK